MRRRPVSTTFNVHHPLPPLTWRFRRRSANGFVESLQKFHVFIVPKNTDMRPVRVAILDTGLRFSTKALKLYGSRQIEFRTWLNHSAKSVPVKDGDDPGGHGTRCATAFLQCSSDMTELFVGQVLESRDPKAANAFGPRDDPERVAEVCTATPTDQIHLWLTTACRLSGTPSKNGA
jgi:hypothetical protein